MVVWAARLCVRPSTASAWRGLISGLIRLQGREEEGKGKEGGAASSVSRGGRRKGSRGKEGGRGGSV
jgi:hypothetical protein